MPKKKRISLPKILFSVLGTSVLWIILVLIPAGIQIYQFFGGTVNMLDNLPSWVWFAPLYIYIVYVFGRTIYEYQKELKEDNSSNQPIRKRKEKVNKANNQGIAMQDVNNSPVTQNFYQEKSKLHQNTKPILRIRDYGNEIKNLYGINDFVVGYDTLYIDIFNKQKMGNAERVWSQIEWINDNTIVEVSHRGRWHIATKTMQNEPVKEDLQYRIIDSNQAPQRLYFAWTPKENKEKHFYGLERDMDGRDSWGHEKYKLEEDEYIVKITLQGNDGVKQQFKYRIRNDDGKISIVEALTNESKTRN